MLSQAYSIYYGAFQVGGSTGYPINGAVRLTRTIDQGTLAFQVAVLGTSDADMATKVAAFEAAFTARRVRIRWLQGAAVRVDWNPAGTTDATLGYRQVAVVDKVGTPGGDTGRSVLYNVTLSAALPVVDQSGVKGLTTTVVTGPNCVRTVTIAGVTNAIAEATPATATEVYDDVKASVSSTQLNLVDSGATWKLHDEQTSRDETDTELTFTRTYTEVVIDAGETIPDDPNLRDFAFLITDVTNQPGDTGGDVVRLREFLIVASATFCVDGVTDPLAYYRSSGLRDFLLGKFRSEQAPDEFGIRAEQVTRGRYVNSINISITIEASVGATTIIQSVGTTKVTDIVGIALTGAWDGNPLAKYVDQGLGRLTRRIIWAQRILGVVSGPASIALPPNMGGVGAAFALGGQARGWIRMGGERTTEGPRTVGIVGEDQITYTDVVQIEEQEYVETPGLRRSPTDPAPSLAAF